MISISCEPGFAMGKSTMWGNRGESLPWTWDRGNKHQRSGWPITNPQGDSISMFNANMFMIRKFTKVMRLFHRYGSVKRTEPWNPESETPVAASLYKYPSPPPYP